MDIAKIQISAEACDWAASNLEGGLCGGLGCSTTVEGMPRGIFNTLMRVKIVEPEIKIDYEAESLNQLYYECGLGEPDILKEMVKGDATSRALELSSRHTDNLIITDDTEVIGNKLVTTLVVAIDGRILGTVEETVYGEVIGDKPYYEYSFKPAGCSDVLGNLKGDEYEFIHPVLRAIRKARTLGLLPLDLPQCVNLETPTSLEVLTHVAQNRLREERISFAKNKEIHRAQREAANE